MIVFRFAEHQPLELRWCDSRLENLPELDDDVLGGGNDSLHEVDVEIEVPVINFARDLALDDVAKPGEIENVASALFDLAFDRNLERVVMTVPVGIVAFPERGLVLFVAERRIENAMGRIERHPARDSDSWHVESSVVMEPAHRKLNERTTGTKKTPPAPQQCGDGGATNYRNEEGF
jgi:hypothetical protein